MLVGSALLSSAVSALTMQTFNFSGLPIEGGDDPGYFSDVTIEFTYDDTCMTSSCTLTIELTYNGSNQANLGAIGHTLASVAFDAFSDSTQIDLDVSLGTSTVAAEAIVGAGSDDIVSGLDVTRHWGFVSGFSSSHAPPLGTNLFSSVGDAFPDTDVLGNADLFTSGTLNSAVENNPPDGTSFSIVDDNTCSAGTCGSLTGGFQDSQNRAWIQNTATGTLKYDGTTNKLTSIDNVDPIFGTEGRPIPEPGTLGLMGLGLLGLWSMARRRQSS